MILFIKDVCINTDYLIGVEQDSYAPNCIKITMAEEVEYVVPCTMAEFQSAYKWEQP